MTGHRPFSELQEGLDHRLADRDGERQRIWAAVQAWTEVGHRLGENGEPVPVEGTVFRPLEPFFDELHAMIFPDEYLSDEEVRGGDDEVEKRLVRNAARCRKCGDVIESVHRHDFRWCSCRSVAVDGGLDYAKRVLGAGLDFDVVEELSEYEEVVNGE